LGSVARDLEPLDYQVADARYRPLLDAVMAIFDEKESETVPIQTRVEAADAMGQSGDSRLDYTRDDYWVVIPADKFLMGAQATESHEANYDKDAYSHHWESPVHEVHLDAFRLARFPVTVSQYRHFIQDEGYQNPQWWTAGGMGNHSHPEGWAAQTEYPSRPVVGVSWYEAAAFCAWTGFRLPTEAEWERAARGTDGRKYAWGGPDLERSRLNCQWKVGYPTPVGIYPQGATPEGICDMSGNVWEWCLDRYGEYPEGPVSNPRGAESSTVRVLRGGGWRADATICRAAYRNAGDPSSRGNDVGFRLATASPGHSNEVSEAAPPEPTADGAPRAE
jgi:formylglycine-generating enzyme required for sulfatase activity